MKLNNREGMKIKRIKEGFKKWLESLSFRTGVIVLSLCIPCYILSFAQFALPLSTSAKGVLWVVLFGMAKTFQYSGLLILGTEGYKRLKRKFKKRNTIELNKTIDKV